MILFGKPLVIGLEDLEAALSTGETTDAVRSFHNLAQSVLGHESKVSAEIANQQSAAAAAISDGEARVAELEQQTARVRTQVTNHTARVSVLDELAENFA